MTTGTTTASLVAAVKDRDRRARDAGEDREGRMSTHPKVVRDGNVAVLVSRGFGAGWSTWNCDASACLYSPEIVALVEAKAAPTEIGQKAEELWPDGYWGGASGLTVEWVAAGTAFEINEYDGAESLCVRDDINWEIA